MSKVNPILVWDEIDIIDGEVDYGKDNWVEYYPEHKKCPDDDYIREDVYSDSDYLDFAWDDLLEGLTEILRDKNPNGYWHAKVKNFGWRNVSGEQYFNTDNAEEFLRKLLPETDCTFRIFNYRKGLKIQNFHHYSPTGNEWYYILPVKQETYEKNS